MKSYTNVSVHTMFSMVENWYINDAIATHNLLARTQAAVVLSMARALNAVSSSVAF